MNPNDEMSVEQILEAFYQYMVNDRLDIGINMQEAIAALNKLIEKAKVDEAADIHATGFDIAMKDGASAMVVGGTGLHSLLNHIERKHGKDIILHVAGERNQRLSGGKEL